MIVLQLGFATAINTGLVKLDDGTTFASKSTQFRDQLENADKDSFVVAAFGSSRIMNGFDAAGMERLVSESRGGRTVVYNFGVPGGGNIYTYLSIEKLIAQGVRPDLILVEVYPILLRHGSEQDWFAGNEMRSKSFDNPELVEERRRGEFSCVNVPYLDRERFSRPDFLEARAPVAGGGIKRFPHVVPSQKTGRQFKTCGGGVLHVCLVEGCSSS